VTPLIHFTQKDQPFSWGVEVENVFQSLKASFTTAPFFVHSNPFKLFVLEMDTFDFTLSAILLELGKDNLLHLVCFCFRKFLLSGLITRFMKKNYWPS
jgi:hypothetical protein